MPRELADGTPNRYQIIRLKDKLGTRSMASGEVRMDGAIAYPLGHLDAGLKQMAEMINWSRLSNGVKSTALMRRAVFDAWQVYRHRRVFGTRLLDRPLAQRQLLKIQLPSEQALSMSLFTADALDEAEYPGRGQANDARAVLRLATPVLKLRATRDARRVTGDAMEVRGGCGYVEDFVNSRLLRDAHLGSIWEGTSNIVAIDAVRRAIGRNGCQGAYEAALLDRLEQCNELPLAFIDEMRVALRDAIELAEASDTPDELWVRQAVTALYHASSAILLASEGCATARRRGDARRVLWARLVLDHRLYPRGPLARIDRGREAAITEALLGLIPLASMQVAPLLAR
jgi:acyl-CoA dehydrogenase